MRQGMIFRMRKRPKELARVRLRIAVCVCVGLLISLLTAFVPAIFGNVDYVGFEDPLYTVENPDPPQYLHGLIPEFRTAVWCAPSVPQYRWQNWFDSSIVFHEYYYGMRYNEWDLEVHGEIPPSFMIRRGSYGFPFQCMYADEVAVANGGAPYTMTFFDRVRARSGLREGVLVSGLNAPMVQRILPLAPHWGGLMLNTLIYGGGLGAFFVLPVLITRAWRIRNRLCLVCGYAIEDLDVCPECGHTTRVHAAA